MNKLIHSFKQLKFILKTKNQFEFKNFFGPRSILS